MHAQFWTSHLCSKCGRDFIRRLSGGIIMAFALIFSLAGCQSLHPAHLQSTQARLVNRQLPLELSLDQFKICVKKNEALILDVRDEQNYRQGHVPGALLLPYEPQNNFEAAYKTLKLKLEADKNRPIVLYCMGSSCPLSEAMRNRFVSLGYTDIAVFSAGWDAWHRAGLPEQF
jgi:rhodanese-related sulfurtransferase